MNIALPLPFDLLAHCIEKIAVADYLGRLFGIDND